MSFAILHSISRRAGYGVLLLFFFSAPVFADVDADKCQDAADRLSRRARDASESADKYRAVAEKKDKTASQLQLKATQKALDEVKEAVKRAEEACGGSGVLFSLPQLELSPVPAR